MSGAAALSGDPRRVAQRDNLLVLEKALFLPTAMNYRGPVLETAQTFGAIERPKFRGRGQRVRGR
jgi:hypothetical protein